MSHLPLLTPTLKAEPPADMQEAALRALGTRGGGACVGAMQSSSALGADTGCPQEHWRSAYQTRVAGTAVSMALLQII